MKILIGDSAISKDGFGTVTALKVGSCEVLSMERTPQGIYVNADLYYEDGQLAATIRNNEITALNGETFSVRKNNDLNPLVVKNSKLFIKDRNGVELLHVEYLNPLTVRMRGLFGCPGHKSVAVRDNGSIGGNFYSASCFANSNIGIWIR